MITDVEGMFSGYTLLSHLTGEGVGEGGAEGRERGGGEERARRGGEGREGRGEGERRGRCVHAAQFEVLMKEKQSCYSIYNVL